MEIYPAVDRLSRLLNLKFTFPILHGRNRSIAFPEMQIVALIIVATKLSQPFDDVLRTPTDATDPTALAIAWDKWTSIMAPRKPAGLERGAEIKVTDEEALKLVDSDIDVYLDWYQRTWVDDVEPKSKSLNYTHWINTVVITI